MELLPKKGKYYLLLIMIGYLRSKNTLQYFLMITVCVPLIVTKAERRVL